MDTREIYKEKYQAQIHEWTAKLDVLKARGEMMSAQAKLDAKPSLDAMHEKLEHAKSKMSELAAASDDKWEEIKKSLDHAWTETKSAIEGAYDAILAVDPAPSVTPPVAPASRGPGQGRRGIDA